MGEPGSLDPIPNVKTSSFAKKAQIKVCSWNIRRGLILREQELKSIIQLNKLNIIFLVETDTSAVNSESDYKIEGFRTIIQNKKEQTAPTRIVGLIDETLSNRILIRHDLTSNDFPSLWIEIENERGPNTICGGFYREWAPCPCAPCSPAMPTSSSHCSSGSKKPAGCKPICSSASMPMRFSPRRRVVPVCSGVSVSCDCQWACAVLVFLCRTPRVSGACCSCLGACCWCLC